jgi:SP family myo-inositol transporter-like MFS transporter 13
MSSAEEPLISRHSSPSEDHPDNDNDTDTYNGADIRHDTTNYDAAPTPASPTLFIYLLTLSAGISGLLFGCKPPLPGPSPIPNHHLL